MSRELDAECARAMEWVNVRLAPCYGYSSTPRGTEYFGTPPGKDYEVLIPYYTETRMLGSDEDWADESRGGARLLEDEIERRDLNHAYDTALLSILGYTWDNAGNAVYSLIRATPEQRAQAFLKVVNHANH